MPARSRQDRRLAAPRPRSVGADLAAADRHPVSFVRDNSARGIKDDEATAIVTGGIAIRPDDLAHQALGVAQRNTRRRVTHEGAGEHCRHAGLRVPGGSGVSVLRARVVGGDDLTKTHSGSLGSSSICTNSGPTSPWPPEDRVRRRPRQDLRRRPRRLRQAREEPKEGVDLGRDQGPVCNPRAFSDDLLDDRLVPVDHDGPPRLVASRVRAYPLQIGALVLARASTSVPMIGQGTEHRPNRAWRPRGVRAGRHQRNRERTEEESGRLATRSARDGHPNSVHSSLRASAWRRRRLHADHGRPVVVLPVPAAPGRSWGLSPHCR